MAFLAAWRATDYIQWYLNWQVKGIISCFFFFNLISMWCVPLKHDQAKSQIAWAVTMKLKPLCEQVYYHYFALMGLCGKSAPAAFHKMNVIKCLVMWRFPNVFLISPIWPACTNILIGFAFFCSLFELSLYLLLHLCIFLLCKEHFSDCAMPHWLLSWGEEGEMR